MLKALFSVHRCNSDTKAGKQNVALIMYHASQYPLKHILTDYSTKQFAEREERRESEKDGKEFQYSA